MKPPSTTTANLLRSLGGPALLLLILAFQLVHVARVSSATWDEPHHLYDGYTVWRSHDYRLNPEVPPLVKLTAALPLLPMRLYAPPNEGRSEPKEAFLDGRAFVFGNGGDRVLFPARLACALFPLVLAALVYSASRSMFGPAAALAALAFFVFDPNVLANGSLVTTDLASACCLFAAVYAFYRYTRTPTARFFVLAGLAAGLTLAAKFTGILVVPILLLLAAGEALRARSFAVLGRRLAACVGILLCAWVLLWAFYGFQYMPGRTALRPALIPYIESIPNGAGVPELLFAAHHHLLPAPYLWGLANTKHTEWEYTSYFFGRIYRHGPWQYFPAAFLIKSTLPLLIFLALFPFLGAQRRHARELAFLLLPVAVYCAVVTASHFDIGARHLLPIYPFLYVLAGAAVAAAFRGNRAWASFAAILLLWQAATSLHAAPTYMSYGNEAWGGPSNVHRYLSDANVDWGQQLKDVKRYLDRNRITDCWFAYFPDGAIEPRDYGIPCKRLPTGSSLWWFELPMEVPPAIHGTVLISDSDLEGVESGDGALNWFNPFRAARPAAVIDHGVSVYVGRFEVPLMSALVQVRDSQQLAAKGQTEAALSSAVRAVQLAPGSAIVQLNLADRLAAQKQWPEAQSHYQTAQTLAQATRPDLQEDVLAQITTGLAATKHHP